MEIIPLNPYGNFNFFIIHNVNYEMSVTLTQLFTKLFKQEYVLPLFKIILVLVEELKTELFLFHKYMFPNFLIYLLGVKI